MNYFKLALIFSFLVGCQPIPNVEKRTKVSAIQSTPISVQSVAPDGGPPQGGTLITIKGQGFDPKAKVRIKGRDCLDINFINPSTIACRTPGGSLGFADISVINPNLEGNSAIGLFSYRNPPAINFVRDKLDLNNSGPDTGGTRVRVSGSSFSRSSVVRIGSDVCTDLLYINPGELECTTPPGPIGFVNASVRNPENTNGSLTSAWVYLASPKITSISPNGGLPSGGGIPVVISGSFLENGATIKFGQASCRSYSYINSPSSITCSFVPSGNGTVDVTVTNTNGTATTITDGYTYRNPPGLLSVFPAGGTPLGGTLVTITGSGFVDGASVFFDNNTACTNVNVINSTKLTCVAGAHSLGAVNVKVFNPDEQVFTLNNAYTYRNPPVITSFKNIFSQQANGSTAGGNTLNIEGAGFLPGVKILLGDNECRVTSFSTTLLSCITPAGEAGSTSAKVINSDLQEAEFTPGFLYIETPRVFDIFPRVGALAGGTKVTITGDNFDPGVSVKIGGVDCAVETYPPPTTKKLVCITGANSAGFAVVVIQNSDRQEVRLTDLNFLYRDKPIINSVSPSEGPIQGGNVLSLLGVNFSSSSRIWIGEKECVNPAFNLINQSLTCTVPYNAIVGPKDVEVINTDDNQKGVSIGAYNYRTGPVITNITPNAGPLIGGNIITLSGVGLRLGSKVFIDNTPCTVLTNPNDNSLTCQTPQKSQGSYDVKIVTTDNQNFTIFSGYSYFPAPDPINVTPSEDLEVGGATLSISGSNFRPGVKVSLGGAACAVISSTFNSIQCVVGPIDKRKELVQIETLSDIGGSLDGKYFVINTPERAYAIWFDIGNTGTPEPAHGVTNSIKVQTVQLNDSSSKVALAIFNALSLNSDFEMSVSPQNNKLFIKNSFFGDVAVPDMATSGFNYVVLEEGKSAQSNVDVIVTNVDNQEGRISGAFSYRLAPVLSDFNPKSSPLEGGQQITIFGTNFSSEAKIFIGENICDKNVSITTGSISCDIPAASRGGRVDVKVINPDDQFQEVVLGFEYLEGPIITSINPIAVPANQNTLVAVQGKNFIINNNFNVKVNDVDCLSLSNLSAGQFNCLVPSYPGVLATNTQFKADIEVINGDGQIYRLEKAIIYGNGPQFGSVVVDSSKLLFDEGPLSGGRTIQISGQNLFPGIKVVMGVGTECTDVKVISPTLLSCVTPPKAQGSYTIDLIGVDGQTDQSPGNVFTYQLAPIATAISPSSFNESDALPLINVSGSNFRDGALIIINGKACNTNFISGQSLTCDLTSPLDGGKYSVQILNPDHQSSILGNSLTIIPRPKVIKVTPSSMSHSLTREVKIRGEHFVNPPVVTFGGNLACTPVNYIGPNELSCTITGPGEPRNVGVRVTNPDQQFNSNFNDEIFSFASPPILTQIKRLELADLGLAQTISEGPVSGGNVITIFGSNFLPDAEVFVGAQKCSKVEYVGITQIKCTVPPSLEGESEESVYIINPDGITSNELTYKYNFPPVLESIDFNYATLNGQRFVGGNFIDSVITLSGEFFRADAIIKVGGLECKSTPIFNDSNSYQCTIPDPGVSGTYKTGIEIINADGQSSFLFNAITYQGPPEINSITPNEGALSGENILIFGENFNQLGVVSVVVDNLGECSNAVVTSNTTLNCRMPSSPVAGPRQIRIVNVLDNQESANLVVYNYNEAPQITSVSFLSRAGNVISNPDVLIPENEARQITINGQFFLDSPAPSIYIDNILCANITYISSTELSCLSLGAEAGVKNISIENRDRQVGTFENALSYVKTPVVTSILEVVDAQGDGDKARGSLRGNYELEIVGENFLGRETPEVILENGTCTSPVYLSDTKIRCSLSPVSGFNGGEVKGKVILFNGAESEYSTNAFYFIDRPLIDLVSPQENLANNPLSQIFNLEGRFIEEGYYLWFVGPTTYRSPIGTNGCTVSSNRNVECFPILSYNGVGYTNSVASLDTGVYYFIISDNGNSSSCDQINGEYCSVLQNGIIFYGPPAISSVLPNQGTTDETIENTRVTITGSNFTGPIKVFVGDEEAVDCLLTSETQITNCLIPTFEAGFKSLQLYTKYQDPVLEQNIIQANSILYQEPPMITGISGGLGAGGNIFSIAGGEPLTITGTNINLNSQSTISINGADCPVFERSGTVLKCLTPNSLSIGLHDVILDSPYPVLQSSTSTEQFDAQQSQLDLSESSFDFGESTQDLTKIFTLTNNGNVTARVSVTDPVTIVDSTTKNNGFTISNNGCGDSGGSDTLLGPGGTCSFTVTFWGGYQESDAFFGPISDSIVITATDGASTTLLLSAERIKIVYQFSFNDSTTEKIKSFGFINDWDSADTCTESWDDFTIKNTGNTATNVAIRTVPNPTGGDRYFLLGGERPDLFDNNCIIETRSWYDVGTVNSNDHVLTLRNDLEPYNRRIRLFELTSDVTFGKVLQPGESCQFRVVYSTKIPYYKNQDGVAAHFQDESKCTNTLNDGTGLSAEAATNKETSGTIRLYPSGGSFEDGIKLDMNGKVTD